MRPAILRKRSASFGTGRFENPAQRVVRHRRVSYDPSAHVGRKQEGASLGWPPPVRVSGCDHWGVEKHPRLTIERLDRGERVRRHAGSLKD
jgi:hypothetical protein